MNINTSKRDFLTARKLIRISTSRYTALNMASTIVEFLVAKKILR